MALPVTVIVTLRLSDLRQPAQSPVTVYEKPYEIVPDRTAGTVVAVTFGAWASAESIVPTKVVTGKITESETTRIRPTKLRCRGRLR